MTDWFADWINGDWTPEGAETFAALRARGCGGQRALALPPVVLVVGHGALFRGLRSAMGLETNCARRTRCRCFASRLRWGGG